MQLTFNQIIELDEFEEIFVIDVDLSKSAEIQSIKNIVFEPTKKKSPIEKRQLMFICAVTSNITSESASISKKNFDPTFIPKAPNSNRKVHRSVPKISNDVIAMNIKFRKQTYAAAFEKMIDFFFYSAFAVKLIRFDIEQKNRLH